MDCRSTFLWSCPSASDSEVLSPQNDLLASTFHVCLLNAAVKILFDLHKELLWNSKKFIIFYDFIIKKLVCWSVGSQNQRSLLFFFQLASELQNGLPKIDIFICCFFLSKLSLFQKNVHIEFHGYPVEHSLYGVSRRFFLLSNRFFCFYFKILGSLKLQLILQ